MHDVLKSKLPILGTAGTLWPYRPEPIRTDCRNLPRMSVQQTQRIQVTNMDIPLRTIGAQPGAVRYLAGPLGLVLLVGLLTPAATLGQPQVSLEIAFPELRFVRPVDLQHRHHQIYVVEQSGRIWTFANDPQSTERQVFLDIRSRVSNRGNEEGLLGLAFHPDHETNGHFFVYYSASSPRRSVLARYSVSAQDTLRADPTSEEIILTLSQPASNHNGGQIAFGPDGYLYIAFGDGGGANDPFGHGQNRTTLLGTIARIDVDQTPYGIPSDNPFAGSSVYREEIYAWGLRNPWRFNIDFKTGYLYAADVGQSSREEINIITRGGNYGWNIMEGTRCFRSVSCNRTGLELPIYEYNHQSGAASVTGGYVYYGPRVPDLGGWYVFADYVDGRVWGLVYQNDRLEQSALLLDTSLLISSFGRDHRGEVYALAFDGFIYRFTSTGGALGFEEHARDYSLVQHGTAAAITLPAATGGTPPYFYRLYPADLPAGLSFDEESRQILGTPSDSSASTLYDYRAFDAGGREGIQLFRLEVKAAIGTSAAQTTPAAEALRVHGNYPNPFADQTRITFDLSTPSEVSLAVLDIRGRQVAALPPRRFDAGAGHSLQLPTNLLSSGPYLARITANSSDGMITQTIPVLRVR